MTTSYKLGPLSQIPEGEGRTFQVGTRRVAVFRTRAGGVFASQAECPHRSGPLADGLLGDSELVCPLHDWRFDLQTGKAVSGACDLRMYAVTAEPGGELLLDLPSE